MPSRTLIVLGLVVLVALGAAWSLKNQGGDPGAQAPTKPQVIVATGDISAGTFIRSDSNLALVDWPEANITESMLTNINSKVSDFNGAVARRTIQKGEPILKNLLVKSNEGGFMSAVLEPGKRAVSIAVDSTTGNAGFIFPGDRVDLILTHAVTKQNIQNRASETFIEDVRVLAVDQMTDNPDNKAVLAKTVTLEVSPKQAEEINLAKDLGKISLSLRSLASNAGAPIPKPAAMPETLDDILKNPPPANTNMTRDTEVSRLISPEDIAGAQVTIIRGTERSIVQFGPNAQGQPSVQ